MTNKIKTYFNNVFTLNPKLKTQHENFLNKYLPMTSFYTVYYYINSDTLSNMIKPCLRLKGYNHTITMENRFMTLLSCLDSMQVKKTCHLSDAGCPVSLKHSHRLSYQFMDTVAKLPKKHRLILAYDIIMHWLIVMDLETGQRIKQDAPDYIINTPDFNYEKNNNELFAIDRKELIKGLQTSKDDYVFIQYNEDLKSYIFAAGNTTVKVKTNEIQ